MKDSTTVLGKNDPTTTSTSDASPFRVWAAFAVVSVSVLWLQYVTLKKLQGLVVSTSGTVRLENIRSSALSVVLGNVLDVLGPLDVLFGALLAVGAVGIVVAEVRYGTVSRFCSRLETHAKELWLFLLLLSVLATRYYLNAGDVFMSDAESLGVRAWMVSELFARLHWPVWSNYWYMGFPLNHYYGPLYFALVGALNLVVGNFHLATKLVLWSAHIGSIFAMFFFLRTALRSIPNALLGALAYGIVFYRIGMILYSGDMNLNLVWLFYPLLLLAAETYFAGRMPLRRNLLFFTGCAAGLILTHHAHAFFGLTFAIVYLGMRVLTWQVEASAKLKAIRFFGCGLAFACLIGAFSLLPFTLDYADVRGMPNIPLDRLLPSIRSLGWFEMLVRWSPIPTHSSTEAYVGASLVLLAALAAIYIVRSRDSVGLSLLVCGVYAFSTVRAGTQYGPKNLNYVIFYLSALTAFAPRALQMLLAARPAYARLRTKWGPHLDARLAVLLSGLILVDLGPLTFQDTFIKDFYRMEEAGYQSVLDIDRNYRVLERRVVEYDPSKDLRGNFEPDRLGIVSPYKPIQSPLGRMNEEAARSISYSAEMIKRVQLDLNEQRISDLSLEGLLLMNVRFLVFRDRAHFFAPPLTPMPGYSINGQTLELTHTRPLLVSTRVIPVGAVDGLDDSRNPIEHKAYWDRDMLDYRSPVYDQVVRPLLEKMNINLDSGTADYLITRRDEQLPALAGNPHDVKADIKSFEVTIDTVRLEYSASGSAYARLPFSYFPYLDVRVDGAPTPFFRDAMHCILLPLPSGEHVISIRGQASPLQKGTFPFSLIATALIVALPSRGVERLVGRRTSRT